VIQDISPQQAQELLSSGSVDLVDVREPNEWSRGHLPGARHVPLQRIKSEPSTSLPRDGVIFVCAAGMRSQLAARVAEAMGLTRLYNLRGGLQSWATAGLPLVRG
jgi:rhodanese-related sulfurtransferase